MRGEERRLGELFRRLPEEGRRTLLEFAEFLAARAPAGHEEIPEPKPIPRPDEETVVKAIKRLMATYHMLDRGKLLHETAHYMSQHTLHGRPAAEVIEDLEKMFERHYQGMREEGGGRRKNK